ncbi:phenylalanine--tRNA ligase beta subunit-related protein [Streptomyces sp. NBC_01190]|uniref:phenylalanine--tRNA ligase beta subunit-related protein n=1 Tax=Streptomyces sp. NBC_01190 TaxID=2903767 RepID=UPI0038704A73|nr:phenylalanine--tRNA ligase beta subunit-related protein [Streptomyces sp. NBC_01190]
MPSTVPSTVPSSEADPAALSGVKVLTLPAAVAAGANGEATGAGTKGALAEATDRLWLAQHAIWHGRSRAEIRNHPRVAAYRAFSKRIGVDPDRFPPSIQALIDRGLRNKPAGGWPHVNPVVDAVNAVAVTDLAALGVFDAEQVTGEVRLTTSQGGEEFLALGADEVTRLEPGRLVLADDLRVLSLFGHRDGVHQMVTDATRRVILLGCVVPGVDADSVAAGLTRTAALLTDPTGARS